MLLKVRSRPLYKALPCSAWLLLQLVLLSLILPFVAYCQAPPPLERGNKKERLSFEVATVKRFDPSKEGSGFGGSVGPDQNGLKLLSSLKFFIGLGYGIEDLHISGLPAWATSSLYEVVAKTSAPSTPLEVKEMVRSLLEDRFKLTTRLEIKEEPIYTIKVSKGGLKMKAVDASVVGSYSSGRLSLHGEMPTSEIARQLTADLRRTVIDNTGLDGRYRVDLTWIPDAQAESGSDTGSGTSIFTAIQEQLGLKLETAKGPVQTLVIDHIERPSEN